MKQFLCLAILMAAAGCGDGSKPSRGGDRGDNSARVERRDIAVTVDTVGEISAANQVAVKAEVSGKIHEIAVIVGQTVKRGELLVALDDTDLLTEQKGAQTEIAGAELQLTKAKRDFERQRELFAGQLVSQEVFDNARTALDLAQNDFERAQRRLQTVQDKLEKVRILAPFDGTVLTLPVSKGQVVSGATSVSQGTELMSFADLSALVTRAHISQVDVAKVQVGQPAEITVDTLPGVKLTGQVALIAPLATTKAGIKGFAVDILITQTDARIRPGMNSDIHLPVSRAEKVLSVPVSAIFTEGKEKVVYVRAAGKTTRRVVELGVSDYNYCEVKAGLAEGDVVALEKPADRPAKS